MALRKNVFRILTILPLLCLHIPAGAEEPVHRIISLSPPLTEMLYLLHAEDALVGNTIYCSTPPAAQSVAKVGSILDVNIEQVLTLRPDIVFVSELTPHDVRERLSALGIRIEYFPQANGFDALCEQFLRIADLTGRRAEAQIIIAHARAEVDTLARTVAPLPHPTVFIQIGNAPLFTVPQGSFLNEYIEMAGGINIAQNAGSGIYSREQVIAQDPDVIIITAMTGPGTEQKRAWERIPSLKATRAGSIHIVDSYLLCSPTPVSFANALRKIALIIHPELRAQDLL